MPDGDEFPRVPKPWLGAVRVVAGSAEPSVSGPINGIRS